MQQFTNKQPGDIVKLEVKGWWTSKTLWLNVITFVLAVVAVAQTSPLFADKTQVLEVLTMVNAIGNFILRFISNSPITFKSN